MAGKLVIIYPDGSTDTQEYATRSPSMEQLQKAVGGWFEQIPAMVRYDGRLCRCYADEEGLLKNLPVNHHACRFIRHTHRIVGPFVIEVPAYGHERAAGLVKRQLEAFKSGSITPRSARAAPRQLYPVKDIKKEDK